MKYYFESNNKLLPRHIILASEDWSDFIVLDKRMVDIVIEFFGATYENRLQAGMRIQSFISELSGTVRYSGQVIGSSYSSLISISSTLRYKDVLIFKLDIVGADATVVVDYGTYELVGVVSGVSRDGAVMQSVPSTRLTKLIMETPFIKWA